MILLLIFFTFNLILRTILSYLALFLTKKKIGNREKRSPFECGFDPKNRSRLPFSLRFFLITVIFLIFDVEIILLLPYLISNRINSDIFSLITSIIVVLVLLGGTLYEWMQGRLKWVNR